MLGQTKKAEQKQPSAPKGVGDQVEISSEARMAVLRQQVLDLAREAQALDPTNNERIEAAKAKLSSGAYLTDETAREVASKAVEDLI